MVWSSDSFLFFEVGLLELSHGVIIDMSLRVSSDTSDSQASVTGANRLVTGANRLASTIIIVSINVEYVTAFVLLLFNSW